MVGDKQIPRMEERMRVIHVISSIDRSGGGPSRSSQALVASLRRAGCDACLLSCREGENAWIDGVDRFYSPQVGESCRGFFKRLFDEIQPDIVHIHGIWQWELHCAVGIALSRGVPYLISPRGMLEPWSLAQKKCKKALAMFLYQKRDLRRATALHATAESEQEHFRKLGLTQECIISPNGVVLPESLPERDCSDINGRRALFLSRMHPKKGVMELVESWARVRPVGWTCELVYTAKGEEEELYERKVRARVDELSLSDQFIFTGALDDEEKWAAYRRADLFVLPTYSENFGIVIAEALYAEVPVLTTQGTPWQELESRSCGWWIKGPSGEVLDGALRTATSKSTYELAEMGVRGRRLVEERYTWSAAASALLCGYKKLLKKQQRI